MAGRNPIWNTVIEQEVLLEEKLEFASNIMICFYSVPASEVEKRPGEIEHSYSKLNSTAMIFYYNYTWMTK